MLKMLFVKYWSVIIIIDLSWGAKPLHFSVSVFFHALQFSSSQSSWFVVLLLPEEEQFMLEMLVVLFVAQWFLSLVPKYHFLLLSLLLTLLLYYMCFVAELAGNIWLSKFASIELYFAGQCWLACFPTLSWSTLVFSVFQQYSATLVHSSMIPDHRIYMWVYLHMV